MLRLFKVLEITSVNKRDDRFGKVTKRLIATTYPTDLCVCVCVVCKGLPINREVNKL